MFGFVDLPAPSPSSIASILEGPQRTPSPVLQTLLDVSKRLDSVQHERQEVGESLRSPATLSLRQIKRIWKSLCSERWGSDEQRLLALGPMVERTLMSKFMPAALQDAVSEVLYSHTVSDTHKVKHAAYKPTVASNMPTVRIGDSSYPLRR